MAYQDTERDPEYPVISYEHEGSHNIFVPLVHGKTQEAFVGILEDDSDEQQALHETFTGNFMDDTPSILCSINGHDNYLTWAEAYNLGRALIDKANEAHYG